MRKIIKLSVLLFVLGLASCNSPLKKSVIEPLEIKDLKDIIEKDTLFEFTYKAIQEIRDAKLTDDVEKAKWSDMTYNRVHKMVQLYSDTLVQSKYTVKIKSDWNSEYGLYLPKADSISNYWKKYKEERSLDNFVKVDLFDIKTEDNRFTYVGFKITPLLGPIDKLDIDYVFIKKGNKKNLSEYDKFTITNERSMSYRIHDKVPESKIMWKLDYRNDDILKNKILEEVLKEYNFEFRLNSITKNGIWLSKHLTEIPNHIKWMLESKEGSYMYQYYREDVVKEFIYKDFISYNRFKSSKIDSIAKTIDPKVIEFLELKDKK